MVIYYSLMSSLFSKFHGVQFCTSDPWYITLLYLHIVLSTKSFTEMPLRSLHDHLIISSWIVISFFTSRCSWLETGLHSMSYCIKLSCLISFVCCLLTLQFLSSWPFFSPLYRISWLSFLYCYNSLYCIFRPITRALSIQKRCKIVKNEHARVICTKKGIAKYGIMY
jgi:hypothetical protein